MSAQKIRREDKMPTVISGRPAAPTTKLPVDSSTKANAPTKKTETAPLAQPPVASVNVAVDGFDPPKHGTIKQPLDLGEAKATTQKCLDAYVAADGFTGYHLTEDLENGLVSKQAIKAAERFLGDYGVWIKQASTPEDQNAWARKIETGDELLQALRAQYALQPPEVTAAEDESWAWVDKPPKSDSEFKRAMVKFEENTVGWLFWRMAEHL
ncbi:MAG: hypothetical protein HY901_24675 [Deltaproteobacteria bacterium]|nr:hypothetical protein [Deltaproteobacteria bacterium]